VSVPHDDRTAERDYPLPHPDNPQREDVDRLRSTLTAIDAEVAALYDRLTTDIAALTARLDSDVADLSAVSATVTDVSETIAVLSGGGRTPLGSAAYLDLSQVAGLFEVTHAASATLTTLPLRRCERATAVLTLTLPPAADCPPGWHRHVLAQGGVVTLAAQGGDTIAGSASLALAQGQTALIVRTGADTFARY